MRSVLVALLLAVAAPSTANAANRVVTLAAGNPLAGAVGIGAATGGPSVHDVVPAEIATKVFKSKSDAESVNGWFARTYTAALKANGFLAVDPAHARYELTAEVKAMAITPLETGAHHKSLVTYRLREIATGQALWEQTQAMDLDVRRGPQYGKIAGMLIFAAATGALGMPASYSDLQRFQEHRPADTRFDVYEGIARGFDKMAEQSVLSLWFNTEADGLPHLPSRAAAIVPAVLIPTVKAPATKASATTAGRDQPEVSRKLANEDVVEVIL